MRKLKGLFTAVFFMIMVVLAINLFMSCNNSNRGYQQDNYRTITGPDGKQMVVVYDDNGNEMLMDYLLFNQLMNSGGYGAVMNHRGAFIPYSGSFRSWRSGGIAPRNNYKYYRDDEPINITTSRSSTGSGTSSLRQNNIYRSRNNSSLRSPSSTSSYSRPSSSLRSPSYSQPSYSSPSRPSSSLRSSSSSRSSIR